MDFILSLMGTPLEGFEKGTAVLQLMFYKILQATVGSKNEAEEKAMAMV